MVGLWDTECRPVWEVRVPVCQWGVIVQALQGDWTRTAGNCTVIGGLCSQCLSTRWRSVSRQPSAHIWPLDSPGKEEKKLKELPICLRLTIFVFLSVTKLRLKKERQTQEWDCFYVWEKKGKWVVFNFVAGLLKKGGFFLKKEKNCHAEKEILSSLNCNAIHLLTLEWVL